MEKDKFNGLIERAIKGSKDDFLRFVTGIYGVDECVFDHIWDVPVIASWEGDTIVTTSLSNKTEDEILDIVDKFIAGELEDAEGCFIPLNKMAVEFTVKELEEWKNKLDSGELKLDYDAIIVYNEPSLQKQYRELVKENSEKAKPKTQEELDKIFVDYVKGVITHERCHLNAAYLVTEVRNNKFVSEEINGAEMSTWEYDDILTEKINSKVDYTDYSDRNEVLVDTLRQMMNNYKEGDSIQDCLFKIIEDREGKGQYTDIDDREVLTMYTLFPEELTEWATFGAYDFIRENKLQKKIMDVCGTDVPLEFGQLKKKVKEYVDQLEEGSLSDKQTQMLEMLGISISRKINKEEVKELATSERTLETLFVNSPLLDTMTFMANIKKEDTIKKQQKGR